MVALLVVLISLGAFTDSAAAHGPSAPVATSYVARVSRVPAGLNAKVVNGDLKMWLRVPESMTLVVIDYRGAPYLRFSRSGVQVNENSSMYYLNQTPIPATPPSSLGRSTPAHWKQVSSGHTYDWHDGRLHALATSPCHRARRMWADGASPFGSTAGRPRSPAGSGTAPTHRSCGSGRSWCCSGASWPRGGSAAPRSMPACRACSALPRCWERPSPVPPESSTAGQTCPPFTSSRWRRCSRSWPGVCARW